MTATAKEKPKSRNFVDHYSDPSATREYAVINATTEDEAIAAVEAERPVTLPINGKVLFYDKTDVKEFMAGCWDAVCHYSKSNNQIEVTFDVGAGTTKMVQAKETVDAFNCKINSTIDPNANVIGGDGGVPDFEGGINFDGDKFDGVDIELPKLDMTITMKKKFTTLPGEYITRITALAQTVNEEDVTLYWKEQTIRFIAGTLRFRGFRLKQDSDDNMDISYSFAYSKSTRISDDIRIGNSDPIEKQGWEYLSVYYADDTSAGRKIKTPVCATVFRVYDYSDFNDLEVPGLIGG